MPVGSRVLVVMESDSVYETQAIIHDPARLDPSKAAEGTINKQLVASGFWIPGFGRSDPRVTGKIHFSKRVVDTEVGTLFSSYADRIAAAGNRAVDERRGGIAKCAQQWSSRSF